jgi:hypothetical protein
MSFARGPQKLKPNLTGGRLHYLKQVMRAGIYSPRHGVTANHCLRLGWVETVCRFSDGSVEAHSTRSRPHCEKVLGERLTDAGRAILKERAGWPPDEQPHRP